MCKSVIKINFKRTCNSVYKNAHINFHKSVYTIFHSNAIVLKSVFTNVLEIKSAEITTRDLKEKDTATFPITQPRFQNRFQQRHDNVLYQKAVTPKLVAKFRLKCNINFSINDLIDLHLTSLLL